MDSAGASLDLAKEVTAIFEDLNPEEQLYSLEVVSEPFGSGTVLGGGAYKLGSEVILTAVPSNGTDFAGWSGDASGTDEETSITIDGHKKVRPTLEIPQRTPTKMVSPTSMRRALGPTPKTRIRMMGLTDGEEMNTHSSGPLLVDTDGDGHDDKSEAFHGTPLNDASDFPFLEQDQIGLWYIFKGKAYDMSQLGTMES